MPKLSLDAVLGALRTVPHPEFKRDLASLGMIRDLRLGEDASVAFKIVLPLMAASDQSELHSQIEREARAAVASLPGVGEIRILVEAKASASVEAPGSKQSSQAVLGQVIAVSSGKGGVGKSTVAVNLATALAMQGARVGLIDADIYGPNVPTMMGVTDNPRIVLDAKGAESFVPPVAHGVKVMSMGMLMPPDQPAVWRGPMLHSVLSQFCNQVQWGELDYLVVDMPPGTGDVQLSLAQLLPISGALLVTTPQEVSAQDVRRAYRMFEKVRVPVLGFVENMSYFKCDGCEKKHFLFGKDGGLRLSRKFGAELLAQLPLVPEVRLAGDEGAPVVVRSPESEAARGFSALASRIKVLLSLAASGEIAGAGAGAKPIHIEIGKF